MGGQKTDWDKVRLRKRLNAKGHEPVWSDQGQPLEVIEAPDFVRYKKQYHSAQQVALDVETVRKIYRLIRIAKKALSRRRYNALRSHLLEIVRELTRTPTSPYPQKEDVAKKPCNPNAASLHRINHLMVEVENAIETERFYALKGCALDIVGELDSKT